MSEKRTSAKVLNDTVTAGDSVAYAVRDGNLAAMRLGRVAGFSVRKALGRDVPVMLIEIEGGSDFGTPVSGTVVRIEKFERVVKLFPRVQSVTLVGVDPVEEIPGDGTETATGSASLR